MPTASDLALRIIKEQEVIIGPLAWKVAKGVTGLKVSSEKRVAFSGSSATALAGLVKNYERLFGPASREVCRDAVKPFLSGVPAADVPEVLK